MERKINRKIDDAFAQYKGTVKTGIVGTITTIKCLLDENKSSDNLKSQIQTEMMNLLQELY